MHSFVFDVIHVFFKCVFVSEIGDSRNTENELPLSEKRVAELPVPSFRPVSKSPFVAIRTHDMVLESLMGIS